MEMGSRGSPATGTGRTVNRKAEWGNHAEKGDLAACYRLIALYGMGDLHIQKTHHHRRE